jgi:insertion element IS1 protein InsB
VAFSAINKSKLWIIKAVDHGTGRTMAWGLGGRDAATFQRLYDQVKHLTTCLFYPADWEALAHVLPPERHILGNAYTQAIERDHSHTRHHLARMTRKTTVVSKSKEMVHAS